MQSRLSSSSVHPHIARASCSSTISGEIAIRGVPSYYSMHLAERSLSRHREIMITSVTAAWPFGDVSPPLGWLEVIASRGDGFRRNSWSMDVISANSGASAAPLFLSAVASSDVAHFPRSRPENGLGSRAAGVTQGSFHVHTPYC